MEEEGLADWPAAMGKEAGPSLNLNLDQVLWMRRVTQACLPYRTFLFARTAPKLDGGKRQEARVKITLID